MKEYSFYESILVNKLITIKIKERTSLNKKIICYDYYRGNNTIFLRLRKKKKNINYHYILE